VPGEGAQAAVGGGADGSGAFAQDLAGGLGVQAEDGAKQDGFGLVGGQGGDQGQGGVGGDGVQGVLGGVVVGGPAGQAHRPIHPPHDGTFASAVADEVRNISSGPDLPRAILSPL
jgi:hypothetical protein